MKIVSVTDGRYLINQPDAVLINFSNNPFYVSFETWNKLTGKAVIKPYVRGQVFKLTDELYKALKSSKLHKVIKTNNTIPSNSLDNTCEHCGGLGHIDAYKHINGGICFSCNGSGKK